MENGNIPVAPIILIIFLIVGFLLFLCMIGLFAFLIVRAAKRRSYDTKRGGEMSAAAGQMSFSFTPQAGLSALPFFDGFELFEGYPLKLENLMSGSIDGFPVAVFDLAYRNVGGSSGGTTTSRQTIYAVGSSHLRLPEFYLRPAGLMELVLNKVSKVDINLAERPGFSAKMLLYGKDEAAIRQLFTGPKLEHLEKNPYFCVFGRGDHLFYYQSRIQTPPGSVRQNVRFLPSLVRLFLH